MASDGAQILPAIGQQPKKMCNFSYGKVLHNVLLLSKGHIQNLILFPPKKDVFKCLCLNSRLRAPGIELREELVSPRNEPPSWLSSNS